MLCGHEPRSTLCLTHSTLLLLFSYILLFFPHRSPTRKWMMLNERKKKRKKHPDYTQNALTVLFIHHLVRPGCFSPQEDELHRLCLMKPHLKHCWRVFFTKWNIGISITVTVLISSTSCSFQSINIQCMDKTCTHVSVSKWNVSVDNISIKGQFTLRIKSQLLYKNKDANSMAAFVKESCIFHRTTRAWRHTHSLSGVEWAISMVTIMAPWLQQLCISHELELSHLTWHWDLHLDDSIRGQFTTSDHWMSLVEGRLFKML